MTRKKPSTKTSVLDIAEKAWRDTRGITSAAWACPGGTTMDPEKTQLGDFVVRWQHRLIAFAIAFNREARRAGLDLETLS